jgi:hypothetical protein
MGLAKRFFLMGICMLVNMLMEGQMDMVNIFGKMELIIRANLKMGWDMGRDFGKKIEIIKLVILIKVNILMTKGADLESFNGLLVIFTKESILKI